METLNEKGLGQLGSSVRARLTIFSLVADISGIIALFYAYPIQATVILAVAVLAAIIVLAKYSKEIRKLLKLFLFFLALIGIGFGIYSFLEIPIPLNIVIVPRLNVELTSPKSFGRYIPGASGEVSKGGILNLTGLEEREPYFLTINGYPNKPPNDELKKINIIIKEKGVEEGYWDFTSLTTDSSGHKRNFMLEAALPEGVKLRPRRIYRARFFVKDSNFDIVLFKDGFMFTIRKAD